MLTALALTLGAVAVWFEWMYRRERRSANSGNRQTGETAFGSPAPSSPTAGTGIGAVKQNNKKESAPHS